MSNTAATVSVSEMDPTATSDADKGNDPQSSVVDAVFDALLAWTDLGLGHAKLALDGSAKAMDRTAKAIDVVRTKLKA